MIDPLRHLPLFSPDAFGQKRIDVIGAGATGSRIVLSLAKQGIQHIHVWDFDRVENHNVPNQAFGLADVGRLKVEALHDIVKYQTGTDIIVHPDRVDGSQQLGEVVYILTDTMSSRREIWDGAIKFKIQVKIMIETRMGVDQGRCYCINPSRLGHIREWEDTLYNDDVAEVSACGASISVGPTAEFLSGLAVWQMFRWFSIEMGKNEGDEPDNEIIFGLRPTVFITRRF